MLFNSVEFLLVFLPLVFGVFHGLARLGQHKLAFAALIAASLAFYAGWNYRFLPLLAASIAFNFVVGRALSARPSKGLLAFGLGANLAVLGYYKYANFFMDSLGLHWGHLAVILPLGISFITFQKVAYLVDSYQGKTAGTRFGDFALFVLFFPQLIAGPITHHAHVIPQFQPANLFAWQPRRLALAGAFFVAGLLKKVALGDTLATWVEPAFAVGAQPGFWDAWVGALAYTFQIYFDFSGYSEMAIGLGLLFNIQLPPNFAAPYQAASIIEFWRRWHMTLSEFLRTYVYIPLGGNRLGAGRRYLNLMATMLVGGLWHGAGWTFVFWGFLHGSYLALNHGLRAWRGGDVLGPLPGRVLTFLAVVVGWVFFRASSFEGARQVLAGMAGLNGFAQTSLGYAASGLFLRDRLFVLAALLAWVNLAPTVAELTARWPEARAPHPLWAVAIATACVAAIMLIDRPSAFIYYQF